MDTLICLQTYRYVSSKMKVINWHTKYILEGVENESFSEIVDLNDPSVPQPILFHQSNWRRVHRKAAEKRKRPHNSAFLLRSRRRHTSSSANAVDIYQDIHAVRLRSAKDQLERLRYCSVQLRPLRGTSVFLSLFFGDVLCSSHWYQCLRILIPLTSGPNNQIQASKTSSSAACF